MTTNEITQIFRLEYFTTLPIWKRNLIACWFGMFATGLGMSQIAPVLPLYIMQLGVQNTALVEQYSGIAFGITFLMAAIFSPIWGKAADIYGRKPMLLRASLGMAIVIFSMGFAQNVFELIGLKTLQGVITGYSTACTTLIATQTDINHAGWALGTISTASVAGSLLGPMIGGYIGETFGFQNIFFITGGLMMIAFIMTALFVKEIFVRPDKAVMNIKETWNIVPEKALTVTIIVTFFVITLAVYTLEPIITVYIAQLTEHSEHVALLAGITFSAAGLANLIAAPRLGKLSDTIGAHKVMIVSLVVAGILFIPQAFVTDPYQLMILRFLLGIAIAGLNPSVYTLIKKITPDFLTGRVFGYIMSAAYLGIFVGAVVGGEIAAHLTIRDVFFITSALLLLNAVWVYATVYKKIELKELRRREKNGRSESI
jgi:MFS transporter, DHA1 family, multidrug resistance protein